MTIVPSRENRSPLLARSNSVSLSERAAGASRSARTSRPPPYPPAHAITACPGHDELGPLASRRPDDRCSHRRISSMSFRIGERRTATPVFIDLVSYPRFCVVSNARFQRWTPIVSAHSSPRPHATRWRSVSRRACQPRRARSADPRECSSHGAPTLRPPRRGTRTSVPGVLRHLAGPRQNAHMRTAEALLCSSASIGIGPRTSRAEARSISGSTPRWPRPSSPRRVNGSRLRYGPKHLHSHPACLSPSTSEGPPECLEEAPRATGGASAVISTDPRATRTLGPSRWPRAAPKRSQTAVRQRLPRGGVTGETQLPRCLARKDESFSASAPPFRRAPTPSSPTRDPRGLAPLDIVRIDPDLPAPLGTTRPGAFHHRRATDRSRPPALLRIPTEVSPREHETPLRPPTRGPVMGLPSPLRLTARQSPGVQRSASTASATKSS